MRVDGSRLQNIAILAHIDAGKTTVTEQLLYLTRSVRYAGAVEDGTTVTDWQVAEQQRGITIGSAAVTCSWLGREITVVDTPGHVDFTVEVERILRVIEGGVVVISAPDGVQAQTETVWQQAARYELPVVGFLNKLDRTGVDVERVEQEIRQCFGIEPVALQLPTEVDEPNTVAIIDVLSGELRVWSNAGQRTAARRGEAREMSEDQEIERLVALDRVVDAVASFDDVFAERVLGGQTLVPADYWGPLAAAVRRRACLPLLAGAARTGAGLYSLADAVVNLLPEATAMRPQRCFDTVSGAQAPPISVACVGDPTAAFVFKTERRRDGQRLAYIRVYSGGLRTGQELVRSAGGQVYVAPQLVRLFGGAQDATDSLACGAIGGILTPAGLAGPSTGETLASLEFGRSFEPLTAPTPVISMTLEAGDTDAEVILRQLLLEQVADDPSLTLGTDPATGLWVLSGMGELHLELAFEHLQSALGDKIRSGTVQAHHRRIPTQASSGSATVRDPRSAQGPAATPASVTIEVRVAPSRHAGETLVTFGNELAGAVDRGAIQVGINHALQGDQTGLAFAAIGVTVTSLQTSAPAPGPEHFAEAAQVATREALQGSRPVLAEPWMEVRLVVPDDHVGAVVGDLGRRRGRVQRVQARGRLQVLQAEAPLAELIGYATDLRSLTGGRGLFTMKPGDYRNAS